MAPLLLPWGGRKREGVSDFDCALTQEILRTELIRIKGLIGTVALALHIDNMGATQALGFVAPLIYFIFIILSTLRLDFWLSTFTGFVAASELLCMAMFYHRAGSADPPPDLYYHSARSVIVLICGMLAGAVGVQLRR